MPMDSEGELRALYADLLDGTADERRLRLLRHLDAGYRVVDHGLVRTPEAVRPTGAAPAGRRAPVSASSRSRRDLLKDALRTRRLGWRLSLPTLPILALGLCITLALAAGSIVTLGKPTNNRPTNQYFPLSGFQRTGPVLRADGLPELLWIGTAWPGDAPSDAERWPVIKALEQFGTFANLAPARTACGTPVIYRGTITNPITYRPCSLASVDWTHARYRSRFVHFTARELIDARGHLFQRLTPVEARLFDRYVRLRPGDTAAAIGASISGGVTIPLNSGGLSRRFPLLSVGGYLQTITQVPLGGDLAAVAVEMSGEDPHAKGLPRAYYQQPLSFDAVRDALATGKTPGAPPLTGETTPTFPGLVPDVNAEANVITALICHADGGKPAGVCGRPVIKQLLRHVK
jgi:hypothetical protein